VWAAVLVEEVLYAWQMDKFERAEKMTPNERADAVQSEAVTDRADMSAETLEMVDSGFAELARRRAAQ